MSSQPMEVMTAIDNGIELKSSPRSADPHHESLYLFKRLEKVMPLPSQRELNFMVAVLFLVMILAGWNDASMGPLLSTLETYYDVNYLVISVIWITNFLGFLVAGTTNVIVTDKFGFGIAASIGAGMQGLGYALMCWGGPYPLFVIAFIFNGFGLGLQDAQVNSLTSRLPNATTKMFLMHALYGFGATVSPFVSTAFVQHVPDRVYLYFTVSLALAATTSALVMIVFRFRTEDQLVGKRPVAYENEGGDVQTTNEGNQKQDSAGKMRRIIQTPVVHCMAFYMVIYVGVEVAVGGWATSFLLDERGGNDDSGYVSSGYYGGITLGRVILIPLSNFFGPHISIWVYTILCIALAFVIWFTHTVVGNAICYAFLGLFIGPLYPIVMNVVVEVIPPELQGGTIGWIASFGQAGSAFLPFIVGAISQRYGVWILQPLIIAFFGASLILWTFVVRATHPHRPFWHIPRVVSGEKEKQLKRDESLDLGHTRD